MQKCRRLLGGSRPCNPRRIFNQPFHDGPGLRSSAKDSFSTHGTLYLMITMISICNILNIFEPAYRPMEVGNARIVGASITAFGSPNDGSATLYHDLGDKVLHLRLLKLQIQLKSLYVP